MENENTTIWISKSTKARLDSLGTFKESYDDLISRLVENFDNKRIEELTNDAKV